MADRLAVMHKGVIRRLGTPEEVYDHPGDCFTARFLGDVNFIPGELRADGVFACALGNFTPASCTAGTGKATGAIRPERIHFAAPGEDGIAGTVTGRTFLGESCEWEVSVSGQTLVIKEGASPVRPLGSSCKLIFESDFFMVMPVETADE